MSTNRQSAPALWPFMVIFFGIVIGSIIVSYIYYKYQRNTLLTEKQLELSSISYLKIRQITQWRNERINDGKFLGDNTLLVREYAGYLKDPANKQLQKEIFQSLKSLTENLDYKDVVLIDVKGKPRLSYPLSDTIIGDHLRPLIPGVIRERNIVLTDLHKADLLNFVHLDLIVPLIDRSKDDTAVVGLLTMRIDPNKILYPLLNSWPSLSKSAESLLFRVEGDKIVFLSNLRHIQNQPPFITRNVDSPKLPASLAINGVTGTIDGIDYRNVAVVAAMNKIPGSPWYLVAKMDREEVLSELGFMTRMIYLILLLIVITSASIIGLILRNQRVRYYRGKYQAELERLAIDKHYNYILKYANDIILLTNSDLKIVEANDRALEYYQYTRDELIGMNVEQIRAPEMHNQLSETLEKINENDRIVFETLHRRKDNSVFPVELSSRAVIIDDVKYYQTIGRDITDRRNVENNLRESEEKFRKIFEESPFSVLMTGKDFYIIRANHAFCTLSGYTEEELKTFTFRNFTHPEHISGDEIALLKLIAGEIPLYHTEKRYICKDGSLIWGSTTVSIIRDKKGGVQFFLVIIENITSRKKAAAELENSFSVLKATLESTEDGILVVDSNQKVVQFNKKFVNMWQIPEDIVRKGDDNLLLEYVKNQLSNPAKFLETVRQLYSDNNATSFDQLNFCDGRTFERYSQPQKVNGESVGRVWSFRDITSKKLAEDELIAAKEKAEENDRLKTAFLHNVSHEIRTPMNAIIGFSTLLNDPSITAEEQRQYTDIIFQSGGQLLSIINDIVDIANVESGQAKVNLTAFYLNAAMKSLVGQFRLQGEQNCVSINLKTALADEDSAIITDNTKLIQILSNLLNNAIKFTRNGQVYCGYEVVDNLIQFSVRDTGIGIPEEYHSRIFDRFYQVDNAVSRQFSGTGLGLCICKGYVELLGGNIRVESEVGKGTRFIFSIPLVKA
jgi:PAS domain S-box-containing protein